MQKNNYNSKLLRQGLLYIIIIAVVAIGTVLAVIGCFNLQNPPVPTPPPTHIPTLTLTPLPTKTWTTTFTATQTATGTGIPSSTNTWTPTQTLTSTPEATSVPSETPTAVPPTLTLTPTTTPTETGTPSPTPTLGLMFPPGRNTAIPELPVTGASATDIAKLTPTPTLDLKYLANCAAKQYIVPTDGGGYNYIILGHCEPVVPVVLDGGD